MTEHAETAGGIAEAGGGLRGGEALDEVSPQGFILAMGGIGGHEEGLGEVCYSISFILKHISTLSY
jgi:hypothetical protein